MTILSEVSKTLLEPEEADDKQHILLHEGEVFSGVTLPSGARVPEGSDATDWVAVEGLLSLKLNPDTPFVIEGFERIASDVFRPIDPNDMALMKITSGAILTGTQLPSGAVVPEAPDNCSWIVVEGLLKLKPTP